VEHAASFFRVTDYDGYGNGGLQQHHQACIQVGSGICLQSTGRDWLLRDHNRDATFFLVAIIRHRKEERIVSCARHENVWGALEA
jgi:hypothetical protein